MNLNIFTKLSDTAANTLIIPVIKGERPSKHVIGAKIATAIENILPSNKEGKPEIAQAYLQNGQHLLLIPIENTVQPYRTYMKLGKKIGEILKKKSKSTCTLIAFESILKEKKEVNLTTSFIEGLYFGSYQFNNYKKDHTEFEITHLEIIASSVKLKTQLEDKSAVLKTIFNNVFLAKDLVNTPPADLTPEVFAKMIKADQKTNFHVEILDEHALIENDLNLIYTVGKGSENRPYLAKISYQGNPHSDRNIALVGKGVTFDSGGTNLKPSGSIETMKMDMAGAATIYALAKLIRDLQLPINVHTYLPLVENTIGTTAYRPGDILMSAAGKTIEIFNTDAEGRLILADALHEATKTDPEIIIDVATLTGACVVALGSFCAGLFATDTEHLHKMMSISKDVFEDVWPLPLFEEYASRTKGSNADLRNIAKQKGDAGSTVAALFLKEFVGDIPWMHLDIAGPAYTSEPHPLLGTEGTGFGVRLLLNFITSEFIDN